MIVYPQLEQGSEEWFRIRQQRPTASQFHRILTAKTLKPSASRDEYINELIAESYIPPDEYEHSSWRFTGQKFSGNKYTDYGTENEDNALESFADEYSADLERVGFVTRDDGIVGCSPDALVLDSNGSRVAGVEAKCKILKNHITSLRSKEVPSEHLLQVHGSMAVTGLKSWWFISWFPSFPLFAIEVKWDSYTDTVARGLDEFLLDYAKAREEVKALRRSPVDALIDEAPEHPEENVNPDEIGSEPTEGHDDKHLDLEF